MNGAIADWIRNAGTFEVESGDFGPAYCRRWDRASLSQNTVFASKHLEAMVGFMGLASMKQFAIRLDYYFREAIKLSCQGRAGQSLPRMIGSFPKWYRSLYTTPAEQELPWITYAGIDFLNRVLAPDMRVFEWGVGGSTLRPALSSA